MKIFKKPLPISRGAERWLEIPVIESAWWDNKDKAYDGLLLPVLRAVDNISDARGML